MKRKYIVFAAIAAVALAALAYRFWHIQEKVAIAEVKRGNLATVVYAIGNVSADLTATLRSEAGGIVTDVGGFTGLHVARGQVLLRTDDRQDTLRVEQARLNVQSAKIDLEDKTGKLQRARELFKYHIDTRISLDEAERDFELADLNLKQQQLAFAIAEERLLQTRVTAPFSGIIISSNAKLGDYLLPGAVAFQMIDPRSILVDAQVDEQDFGRIERGQKCVIAFEAYGPRTFDGYVFRIAPKTSDATRTSDVFVKLQEVPENLNVGMTATVNIITSELHDVLLVPRTAVVQLPSSDVLYTVRGGKVVEVKVELGATEGDLAQIAGGDVRPGTKVISNPGPKIKNGIRVDLAS